MLESTLAFKPRLMLSPAARGVCRAATMHRNNPASRYARCRLLDGQFTIHISQIGSAGELSHPSVIQMLSGKFIGSFSGCAQHLKSHFLTTGMSNCDNYFRNFPGTNVCRLMRLAPSLASAPVLLADKFDTPLLVAATVAATISECPLGAALLPARHPPRSSRWVPAERAWNAHVPNCVLVTRVCSWRRAPHGSAQVVRGSSSTWRSGWWPWQSCSPAHTNQA